MQTSAALDDGFAHIIEMFGEPRLSVPISDNVVDKLRSIYPKQLVDFLIQYEFCSLNANGFRMTNPFEWHWLSDLIFSNDQDIAFDRTFLMGFSAFGELLFWNLDLQTIKINLVGALAFCSALDSSARKIDAHIRITGDLALVGEGSYDGYDDHGKPLYKRAVKRLGEPDLDECFGFFPALALGGPARLENVKRVKAREHFALLAQLEPIRLVDPSTYPPRVTRTLGG